MKRLVCILTVFVCKYSILTLEELFATQLEGLFTLIAGAIGLCVHLTVLCFDIHNGAARIPNIHVETTTTSDLSKCRSTLCFATN